MNEKYVSLYLALLFTFVTTIITTYLQYNVMSYESNCHNRILMNRNEIKIKFNLDLVHVQIKYDQLKQQQFNITVGTAYWGHS